MSTTNPDLSKQTATVKPLSALIDLVLFFGVMFLIREIWIDSLGFWGNSLLRSIATVGLATALLYFRKQSWKDLGLTKPKHLLKALGVTAIILGGTILTLIIFEIFLRDLLFTEAEAATEVDRFSELAGNWPYFFSIIFFVWIESFLEELQDRGFSLNRLEALFQKIPLATILAVVIQAAIFGFRHSYDFSDRSMTAGLIGLVFGTIYVLSKRNLWPLIIAHIIMNSISMVGRV